ncbi:MAG TPA: hypothetical protein VLJ59_15295 [Mycobacteriales bacterium]|nr:hypothetical protein [Mycobacteriales bacterium]
MALLASSVLRAKLRAVTCGFFFEVVDRGQKVILVVKMPSHRTRYLYLGAPAFLSVRRVEVDGVVLLWAAFCIEDDPDESFYLHRVVNEEHRELLRRLLCQDVTEIHVFNEINRCTTSFHTRISTGDNVLDLDAVAEPIASEGETPDEAISQCIEEMGEELSRDASALKQIELAVYQRNIIPHWEASGVEPGPLRDPGRPRQASELHISDQGMASERVVTQVLTKWFDVGTMFPSAPIVGRSGTERELTDIVCVGPYGLMFFEIKAEQVSRPFRAMKRRELNLEKDVRKAVRQLTGAARLARMEGMLRLQNAVAFREVAVIDKPIYLVVIVDEIYSDAVIDNALRSLDTLPNDPLCILELNDIVDLVSRAATAEHFQELIERTCNEHGRHARFVLRAI